MARLRAADGRELDLLPTVRVGRRPGSDLHLVDADVSEHQAELRWDGDQWTCTDVGSKNGTMVGGRVLKRGESAPLAPGLALVFAERQVWSLVDAGPPSWPFAIPLAGGPAIAAMGGELALPPGARCAEVRITAEGAWFTGQSGLGPAPVDNGEVIVAGGRSYRLLLEGHRTGWSPPT